MSESRSNLARAASILTRLLRMGREVEEELELEEVEELEEVVECLRDPAGEEDRLCCWPWAASSTWGWVGTLSWMGTRGSMYSS